IIFHLSPSICYTCVLQILFGSRFQHVDFICSNINTMGKEILQQGAEAVIIRNDNEVIKKRIEKSYRIKILDEKIRKLRTRSEGKIMEKAEKIIPVPKVIKIDEKNKELVLEFINGERISDCLNKFPIKKQEEICERIGENIAKLHSNDIIHGDLTPSNMILFEDKEKREY